MSPFLTKLERIPQERVRQAEVRECTIYAARETTVSGCDVTSDRS
jgi:hypothetical protein